MRLFLGIELPDPIKKELIRVQQHLKELALFTGRYVPLNNLHVTLLFLGSVSEEKLLPLQDRLASIHHPPFTLSLGNLEVPNWSPPRVLWVDTPSDELTDLYEKLSTTLEISESRPYSGHCTLARITQVPDKQELKSALETIEIPPLTWHVSYITLYESQTLQRGAVYTKLADYAMEQ